MPCFRGPPGRTEETPRFVAPAPYRAYVAPGRRVLVAGHPQRGVGAGVLRQSVYDLLALRLEVPRSGSRTG
jgi:hypothetical protein